MSKRWMVVGATLVGTLLGAHEARVAEPAQTLTSSAFACGEKLAPHVQTSLFLDRTILDRTNPQKISDKRWNRFTQEILMREFPAGGSVFENRGWWKSPTGRLDSGEGYMVVVTAPVAQAAEHRAAAGRVVEEIKRQFRQESVLREEEVVCAAF